MANSYPENRSLATKYYNVQLADVSSDSSAFLPIVGQGVIIGARVAISAAVTSANGIVTVKKGADTIGTITIVQVGSAIGSTFQMAISGTEAARSVKDGDVIEFDSDGGCDTTSIGVFTLAVRET